MIANAKDKGSFRVYFNGNDVGDIALRADDIENWVDVYLEGKFPVEIFGEELVSKRLYGKVKIEE